MERSALVLLAGHEVGAVVGVDAKAGHPLLEHAKGFLRLALQLRFAVDVVGVDEVERVRDAIEWLVALALAEVQLVGDGASEVAALKEGELPSIVAFETTAESLLALGAGEGRFEFGESPVVDRCGEIMNGVLRLRDEVAAQLVAFVFVFGMRCG